MDEKLTNIEEDKNQNGIPDWYEEREDNQTSFPEGDLGHAYTSEEKLAAKIPNYKDYKWYKNPAQDGHESTSYFYTLGEKVEDLVENNPQESKEMLEQIADTNSEISEKDVQPLIKEAEQLTDDNPNNDEVDNQAVKEVTKKVFDNMSVDDIEKADADAIKGEGDYLTVAQDLDFDKDDLYYFEQEGYSLEDINNLTEEQKEEIINEPNKESKFSKLKEFLSFGGNVNTELPIEEMSIEEKGNTPITSGVRAVGHSFLGNSGGGGAGAQGGIKVNADIDNDNNTHSSAGGSKTDVKVEEADAADANTASMNGANNSEHIDNTFDDLGFKDVEHEKNIKSNEQADLPDGETWTENNDHFDLPNIKEMMTKQGGGIYLPFKFTIENGELYISQIGTGRKLPFDEFLKAEPFAGKQIIEIMNGDK